MLWFSLPPFRGGGERSVMIFHHYSYRRLFRIVKAMLLRAKRYAFGVRKGTF